MDEKNLKLCIISKWKNPSEYKIIYGDGKEKRFSNFRDLLSFMQEYFGEQ